MAVRQYQKTREHEICYMPPRIYNSEPSTVPQLSQGGVRRVLVASKDNFNPRALALTPSQILAAKRMIAKPVAIPRLGHAPVMKTSHVVTSRSVTPAQSPAHKKRRRLPIAVVTSSLPRRDFERWSFYNPRNDDPSAWIKLSEKVVPIAELTPVKLDKPDPTDELAARVNQVKRLWGAIGSDTDYGYHSDEDEDYLGEKPSTVMLSRKRHRDINDVIPDVTLRKRQRISLAEYAKRMK